MLQWKAEQNILLLLARLSHFHFPGTISLVQVNMLISGEDRSTYKICVNLRNLTSCDVKYVELSTLLEKRLSFGDIWEIPVQSMSGSAVRTRALPNIWSHFGRGEGVPAYMTRGGCGVAWRGQKMENCTHAQAGRPRPRSHLHFCWWCEHTAKRKHISRRIYYDTQFYPSRQ